MVVPTYSEDLTDINLAEATTNFSALGGGGAGLSADIDFSIQTTYSITKQVTGAGTQKGMMADYGSTITMGADDHVFIWVYATCPGLLDSLALGGMSVAIGTATGAFNDYYVAGNDTYALGGHICWAIRYSASTPSPGQQTGTPGANPQWFGGQLKVTGVLRAANLAVDASRYGTGAYITLGDSGTPGTFTGFAALNDTPSNRWGILGASAGGYILQGRFVVGQDNTQTPTAAYFDDSNALIALTDTPHSNTDFTQIIVDHASTTFNMTNITILALGTNNPGRLVFNNASTTSALNTCVFDSMGITTLRAGVTATSCTWRSSGLITQNGATITECIISDTSDTTKAMLIDNISLITDCTFTSGGTGHAIDLGTFVSTTGINWNNNDSGYASTDGSTGNETILVNVATSQVLTINVGSGYSTPTIYNTGDGTVNVVSGQVTTKIIVKNSDGSLLTTQDANVLLEASTGGPLSEGTDIIKGLTDTNGEIEDIRSLASNQPVVGWVRKSSATPYYKQYDLQGTIDNANGLTIIAQLIDDE